MNEKRDNIRQYEVEDILSYLSGNMSRDDMHLLERAMLDDELLADSVEGYRLLSKTMSYEQIVEKADMVRNRMATHAYVPVRRFSTTTFRWLKLTTAACVIVIAGWWMFGINRSEIRLTSETTATGTVQLHDSMQADLVQKNQTETADQYPQSDVSLFKENQKTPTTRKNETTNHGSREVAQGLPPTTGKEPLTPALVPVSEEGNATMETAKTLTDSDPYPKRAAMAKNEPMRRIKFTSVDTSEVVPSVSWESYRNFLESVIPEEAGNIPGSVTIEVLPHGAISQVYLQSNLTDVQNAAAVKSITTGPGWKNKSGKKAVAKLEWH